MTVMLFVLAAMASLAPGRDHAATATAIARVILAEAPLFRGDDTKLRTAALVVAMAFRESSFRNDAVSTTHDHCLLQIHRRPDLADDPDECVRVAMSILRASIRACPAYPIAHYASGTGACENARAQRISRDRMSLADRLTRQVTP